MADETPARDAKIVQYLNEAYAKEKQLETALQAHIAMTLRPPYKKRLQQHLRETKAHAKELERRIKKLKGTPDAGAGLPGPEAVTQTVASVAGKAVAAAQGPIAALRGTGAAEKMLKNAREEFHEEAQEIANYHALEALATALGDKDTAKIAKTIRRDEEKMFKFLEKLIPQLVKAVVTEEIPAKERRSAPASRRRSTSSRGSSSRSSSARSSSSRSSSSRSKPASRAKTGASRSRSTGSSTSRSRASGAGSRRSGGSSGSRRSTSK